MSTGRPRLVALCLVAAVTGFAAAAIGVRFGWIADRWGTADEPPAARVDDALAEAQERIRADESQPQFTGDLLGLHFAPSVDGWPDDYRRERADRLAGGCDAVGDPAAFDFPKPLLPPQTALPVGVLAETGMPRVVSCSGAVTTVSWEFAVTGAHGTPGSVYVSRSVTRAFVFEGSASRIAVERIGPTDAVVVRPITPEGFVERAMIVFPEPFGTTAIRTFNVSEADLLEFGRIVDAAAH